MKKTPTYLTESGIETLRTELDHLITVRRPDLALRLRAAIQMGDLSENADYITTKEEQAFLEGRILELEEMLASAVIITQHTNRNEVSIGATVTIVADGAAPEEYTLVGPAEADPGSGHISHESPIGQALLGKRVGDVVFAQTPAGELTLELVSIT
jgi:transcription elongation factor GreA